MMKAAVLAVYSGLLAATRFSGSQARLTFFVSGGDFTSVQRKNSRCANKKSTGLQCAYRLISDWP